MASYPLPSHTDETAIRAGRRLGLLAKPRAAGSTHPHVGPGGRVHLSIAGNRETPSRPLPVARCALTADVVFTPTGVQRVLSAAVASADAIQGLHALLVNAEQGSAHDRAAANDKLAVALGFADYAELWSGFRAGAAPFVARTVIGWEALS